MPGSIPAVLRLFLLTFGLLLLIPSLSKSAGLPPIGANAGPVGAGAQKRREVLTPLNRRTDSPTIVCKRWAQQSALVNGTLYLYGGRSSTSPDQTTDTWSKLAFEPRLLFPHLSSL